MTKEFNFEVAKKLTEKDKRFYKKLYKVYDKEAERLNKEIANYYARYGKDNVLKYRSLLEELSHNDKKLLMQDIDLFVMKHPEHKDIEAVRKSIYKLDRLEALDISIKMQLYECGEKDKELIEGHLAELYKEGKKDTLKKLGFPAGFNSYNPQNLKATIGKTWVGNLNFYDRIDVNKEKLHRYMLTEVKAGLVRGDSYDRMAKQLKERFVNVSMYHAKRIVATEGTFVYNEAQAQEFEGDFKYYKYDAIMDKRTTQICRNLNGQVFKFEDRQAGVNFPPMHTFCRSSFTVVIDEAEIKELEETEQRAEERRRWEEENAPF